MFRGGYNAENAELVKKLKREYKKKVVDHAEVATSMEIVFVVEWIDYDDCCLGLGCTPEGDTKYIIPNIKPALYVVSKNVLLLKAVCATLGYSQLTIYDQYKFDANSFTIFDVLFDPKESCDCTLVKIETNSYEQVMNLFYKFKKESAYRYALVSTYWDVNKQILCHLMVNNLDNKILYKWFDSQLVSYKLDPPIIPVITFDLETVSTDPDRVPEGEQPNDVLFSAAIHTDGILYSLVHTPINEPNDLLKKKLLSLDNYDKKYQNVAENIIEVYNNEYDMLIRTMQLITHKKLHYLVGYNSKGYDIKYLLLRCAYYGLNHINNFVWNWGFKYGINQIHLDLFRLSLTMFKLKNYKLDTVAQHVLNDNKTGVSAVALRYLYMDILKHQKLFSHQECINYPSIRDMIHYNNYDTILVSEILEKTGAINKLISEAHDCRLDIQTIEGNYNKQQIKVINQCFVSGLDKKCWLGHFNSSQETVKIKVSCDQDAYDVYEQDLNIDELVKPTIVNPSSNIQINAGNFPGGANYCDGEKEVDNVHVYDWRIAYPLCLQKKNLSFETCSICPANILLQMYDFITDKDNFESWDYITHTGCTKSETKIIQHAYINYNYYCGGVFPFTKNELSKRGTSPVIMIWHGKKGIISQIIETFNEDREKMKSYNKLLLGCIDIIKEKINDKMQELSLPKTTFQTNSNDDDDPDDDDDDGEFELIENIQVIECQKHTQKNTIINKELGVDSDSIYIFQNGTCDVDPDNKLNVQQLYKLISLIRIRADHFESMYRLKKTSVSSIYGCIGRISIPLAASLTCIMRTTLFQTAQLLVNRFGCFVHYCDTDSIMLTSPKANTNYSTMLNQLFKYTEIEMKIIKKIMFCQKKTYYSIIDGKLKYGQNTNGPQAWREFVEFFYAYENMKNSDDIRRAFIDFFYYILYSKKYTLDMFVHEIKLKSTYKNKNPAHELREYLKATQSSLANLNKQTVFYYKIESDITKTVFRPSTELTSINQVNLFKFYFNMIKTVYNIIKHKINKNNKDVSIHIPFNYIKNVFLAAYLRY